VPRQLNSAIFDGTTAEADEIAERLDVVVKVLRDQDIERAAADGRIGHRNKQPPKRSIPRIEVWTRMRPGNRREDRSKVLPILFDWSNKKAFQRADSERLLFAERIKS
jgi:hypothetical protein